MLGFGNTAHATGPGQPTVSLITPTAGEVLTVGDTYKITWNSSSNVDKVSLAYITAGGLVGWINFSTPNTNEYDWNVNVPYRLSLGASDPNFKIMLIGGNTGVGSATVYSSNFTLRNLFVETGAASAVTQNSATLSGTFHNFTGVDMITGFWWGTSPDLTNANITPYDHQGKINGSLALQKNISNLLPGTTYYYKADVGADPFGGSAAGDILSFTTLPATNPVIITPPPIIIPTVPVVTNISPVPTISTQPSTPQIITSLQPQIQNTQSNKAIKNTLNIGSRGADVLTLQNILIQNGFLAGKPVGIFGKMTLAAVVAFQKANGLTPDGKVGPKTLGLLNGVSGLTNLPLNVVNQTASNSTSQIESNQVNTACPLYAWSAQNYEWNNIKKVEMLRKIVPNSDNNIIVSILVGDNHCSKNSTMILPDLTMNFIQTNLTTTLTNVRLTDENGNTLSTVIPKITLPDLSVYTFKNLGSIKLSSPDHTAYIQIRATSSADPIIPDGYYGIRLNTINPSSGSFWPVDYYYSYSSGAKG